MTEDRQAVADRRSRILDGARETFLRFGYDRTSLADIAAAAGVSRTALYHYFSGKEDVFRAVVDAHHTRSLRLANDALSRSATLKDALEGLLQAKFGRLLGQASGHSLNIELIDATHRLTGPITQEADDAFQGLVVDALSRHGRRDDAIAVADTLIAAAKGLMRAGETLVSKVDFDVRMHRLVAWVIA